MIADVPYLSIRLKDKPIQIKQPKVELGKVRLNSDESDAGRIGTAGISVNSDGTFNRIQFEHCVNKKINRINYSKIVIKKE